MTMRMKKISIGRFIFFAAVAAAIVMSGCRDKQLEDFNNLEKDRFLVKTEKAQVRDIEDYSRPGRLGQSHGRSRALPEVSGKLFKEPADRRRPREEGPARGADSTRRARVRSTNPPRFHRLSTA
jgi:hypothetical protein